MDLEKDSPGQAVDSLPLQAVPPHNQVPLPPPVVMQGRLHTLADDILPAAFVVHRDRCSRQEVEDMALDLVRPQAVAHRVLSLPLLQNHKLAQHSAVSFDQLQTRLYFENLLGYPRIRAAGWFRIVLAARTSDSLVAATPLNL